MFILTEDTPNPNSIKFLPGIQVMPKGTAEFRDRQAATASPLAKRLFSIDGVRAVFFGSDFVSVTKDDTRDWTMLRPHVLGAIMEHFTMGLPLIDGQQADMGDAQSDDPLVRQIVELIETRVRPAVANDGGDITFVRFDDGIVYLKLQGACSGCPSSSVTLKSGIEGMLKHYVPEVVAVEQVAEF